MSTIPILAHTDKERRLNLTVASRVYLMEPQWNPMVEQQALDRLHRIGQKKEVTTTRYIIRNSIEEVGIPFNNDI